MILEEKKKKREREREKAEKMKGNCSGGGVSGWSSEFEGGSEANNNNNHPLLTRVGWSVMIIDDPKTRFDKFNDLHHLFLDFGCLVHACSEPSQALSLLKKGNKFVDFVICNMHMKAMDKATLFELVGLKDVLVIMMSSYMDMRLVTQGMDLGASSFILRPQSFDDIENISSFVLRRKKYTSKFPWKLYHMFDQVVSQLGGLDEAVPEKILELMNAENIIPIEVIEEHLKGRRLIARLTQLRGTEEEPARFKAPSSGCRIRPEDLLRYVYASATGV